MPLASKGHQSGKNMGKIVGKGVKCQDKKGEKPAFYCVGGDVPPLFVGGERAMKHCFVEIHSLIFLRRYRAMSLPS